MVELCKVDLVYGVSWGRSDQIVFAQQKGGLWRVSAAGGTPTAVTKLDDGEVSHRLPQFLPGWGHRAVHGHEERFSIMGRHPRGGAVARHRRPEGPDRGRRGCPVRPDGAFGLLRRGMLMAVPFDARRLQVSGAPVGLIADVMQAANIQPIQIDTGLDNSRSPTRAPGSTRAVAYTRRTDGRWSGSIAREQLRAVERPSRVLPLTPPVTGCKRKPWCSTPRRGAEICQSTTSCGDQSLVCRWTTTRVSASGRRTVRRGVQFRIVRNRQTIHSKCGL